MEKKREQELSVLEVLRLHREFHLPHPVPADEQGKPLDKVLFCLLQNNRGSDVFSPNLCFFYFSISALISSSVAFIASKVIVSSLSNSQPS